MRKIIFALSMGLFFVIVLMSESLNAQPQFLLQPPKALNSDNEWNVSLLHKHNRQLRLDYNLNMTNRGASLKIGRSPNSYSFRSIPVSGTSHVFNPQAVNLPPGRYYARITNSSATTTNGILSDSRDGLVYSNEILLIIESPTAATIIAPRGSTTDATPTFEWEAVPGVVAYWIIFSSTPFEIVTDENDDLSIEGANLVWQHITSQTTALFGETNPNVTGFAEAPPLNPGVEYSYAILNLYEADNPAFSSAVFGGVIPMTYVNPNAIPAAQLISPANNSEFFGQETITFEWTEVEEAAYYRVNLFEQVTQQGVDATIPIWTTTTTNNLIDYPASSNLKNSRYFWNIVAHDDFGGGTTSGTSITPNYTFTYEIATGEMRAEARDAQDGTTITGVEIFARSVAGGVTPAVPFLLQSTSLEEELVAGVYEFEGRKSGFENSIVRAEIRENQTTNIMFDFEPLPAFINGSVVNENGAALGNALIRLRNLATDEVFETRTNSNGLFGRYIPAGDFSFRVSLPGHISPARRIVSLSLGDQLEITPSIVLTNDVAEVSGFVLSSNGNPIQLATVRAEQGENVVTVNTNAQGFYTLTLSSGTWNITTTRNGFVPPQPQQVSLGTGDNIQNNNFSLTGGANQVGGFVRELRINPDGSTGLSPMENVQVTATPASGSPIVVTTRSNGQFTLNLSSGSYRITARRTGFSAQNNLDVVLEFNETVSNLEIQMTANQSNIAGQVTLPDGTELAGVTVSIPGVGTATTGANGFYSLSTAPGDYSVSANRSGFVSSGSRNVSVAAGQSIEGIDFTLTPNAASITGRVTSAGLAVVGATVTATTSGGQAFTTTTNNLGEYELNVLPATFQVSVARNGFLSPSPLSVTLSAGQRSSGQNFILTANTRPVRGTVSTASGVLRNVTITATTDADPNFSESTVTQVSGNYALSLPAGRAYTIRASREGFTSSTVTTGQLTPSSEAVNFNFTLQANPASIAGTVRNQASNPVAGVTVEAVTSAGNVVATATTSTSGAYNLGLNAGTYTIRARRPGYITATSEITINNGQNLTGFNKTVVENFGRITGTITSSSGNPEEGVLVSISRNQGGNNASLNSTANGSFSYNRLTTGTYTITFSKSGFSTVELTNVSVTDGDQLTRNITMNPEVGGIAGTIRDNSGNIVPNATVVAARQGGQTRSTVANASGQFTFQNVSFGEFTITANATGFTSGDPVTATLTPEDPVDDAVIIDDLIRNNGVITGTIRDLATNAGVRQVTVSVSGPAGSGNTITNNQGQFTISNLSPGTYQLRATRSGFSSFSSSVSITSANPERTLNGQITQNDGTIRGRVTNQQGNPVEGTFAVRVTSDDLTFSAQTNSAGEFTINEVQKGRTYIIRTEAFGEGLTNASREITFPLDVNVLTLSENLIVRVDNARIQGNVGRGGVEMRLITTSNNEIFRTRTSEPDGSYRFRFLPEGNYRVVPVLQGFVFNPANSDVANLQFGQTREVNFTATANVGSIAVAVQNSSGSPVSGTAISVVSTDGEIIRNATTGETGTVTLANLPVGKTYVVRSTRSGFASDPDRVEVALTTPGSTQNVSFTLLQNLSGIAGTVRRSDNQNAIGSARVTITNAATGQSRETTTANNGTYTFSALPAGTYRVVARRSGFRADTLQAVTVAFNTNVQNQNISLVPAQVNRIRGFVRYQGAGVPNVAITISADEDFTLTTNADGRYQIDGFPIRAGANDTTTVVITMTTEFVSNTQILRIPSNRLGQNVDADDFILPSGRVLGTVTDGVNPIAGLPVTVVRSGSSNIRELTTSENGSFATEARLRSGEYRVAVRSENYLLPSQSRRVNLTSDIDEQSLEIILPYRFTPPDTILAGGITDFEVSITQGYSPNNVEGTLFYRQASSTTFSSVPMSLSNGRLIAGLPALLSLEEITFFVEISDQNSPLPYRSPEYEVTPLAINLLSIIRLEPDIIGQRLRTGDTYQLRIIIRDGENNSMVANFLGEDPAGQITVSTPGATESFATRVEENFLIVESGDLAGVSSLTITATLDLDEFPEPQVVARNFPVTITDEPVRSITLSRPAPRIINSNEVSFNYVALDDNGDRILLGSGMQWSLSRDGIGTITQRGRFIPNPQAISTFNARVVDSVSGIESVSNPVSLFAEIREGQDYTFTDGGLMRLIIPAESINETAELALRITRPEVPKKFVVAQGTDISMTASDEVFRIRFSGESLNPGASLILPEPESLNLLSGPRHVARFNPQTLQWQLFDTQQVGDGYQAQNFSRLGQFTVLAENQPLDIQRFGILPNPFSPLVAPGARIGYLLTTDAPPAVVTITIYNLRGQLVRRLITDEEQMPGRYGSSSSPREIYWDGLTDHGTMANNGRYIIRIHAKDGLNEITKLEQIVLIK